MTMASPPSGPSSYIARATTPTKVSRRTSYEVLHGIAGPDSSLPLPRRDVSSLEENGIKEGVPMTFGVRSASPTSYKRVSSPTRTLSRASFHHLSINHLTLFSQRCFLRNTGCVCRLVSPFIKPHDFRPNLYLYPDLTSGNARALAEEGHPPSASTPRSATSARNMLSPTPSDLDTSITSLASPSSPSLQPPPSPNRRASLTPGGTTKVLADLQTGVINARNALENTKAQLRLSQRSVATLTRQTEDLKEGRERLRLENEGLNNVVARKERLLQEVRIGFPERLLP